jgi:hypothetical protein
MITKNLEILIEKLKNKATVGKTNWKKTSRDTEFKLDFQKGAVVTDNWEDAEGTHVDLAVLNQNGDIIERVFYSIDDKEGYNKILEVYELAKKSYYKSDETIRNIFEELDSDKTVGTDGDLPF